MKATVSLLGALLGAAFLVAPVQAQYYPGNRPQAPDACGPGFYCANACGMVYGPNHCVYPPFPPFNGMVFGPKAPSGPGGPGCPPFGPQGPVTFPTLPFARGPRDYFMYGETDLLGEARVAGGGEPNVFFPGQPATVPVAPAPVPVVPPTPPPFPEVPR